MEFVFSQARRRETWQLLFSPFFVKREINIYINCPNAGIFPAIFCTDSYDSSTAFDCFLILSSESQQMACACQAFHFYGRELHIRSNLPPNPLKFVSYTMS